jgi:hypothetical protein
MLHARTGSQHVRRNLEAQLLSDLSNKKVEHAALPGRQSESAVISFPKLTVLRFCNSTNSHLQTLSWHLTELQQSALNDMWKQDYGDPSEPGCGPIKHAPQTTELAPIVGYG